MTLLNTHRSSDATRKGRRELQIEEKLRNAAMQAYMTATKEAKRRYVGELAAIDDRLAADLAAIPQVAQRQLELEEFRRQWQNQLASILALAEDQAGTAIHPISKIWSSHERAVDYQVRHLVSIIPVPGGKPRFDHNHQSSRVCATVICLSSDGAVLVWVPEKENEILTGQPVFLQLMERYVDITAMQAIHDRLLDDVE